MILLRIYLFFSNFIAPIAIYLTIKVSLYSKGA